MRAARPTATLVSLFACFMGGAARGAITQLDVSGYSSLSTQPGLSDSGVLVFDAYDDSTGGYGVYAATPGPPGARGPVLITLNGSNFSPSGSRAPSVSPGGSVAFLGADEFGDGLFRTTAGGGGIITVRGKDFGLSSLTDPSSNDGGMVAFTAVDDATGHAGVYAAAADGSIITISGQSFDPRSPRVSESGMVAFAGVDDVGTPGVYAVRGGGVRLTIQGQNFAGGVAGLDVNGNDEMVFGGVDEFGKGGLFRADGGGLTGTIPEWPHGAASISTVGVNDAGLIAVGLAPSAARSALLDSIELTDLDGSFHSTLISVGDALGGSTVASLSFGPDGLNNGGQLAFFASLADGSSGLFIATVPAPGVAGAVLLGFGVTLSRRRRD